MIESFPKALAAALRSEGGYVNHPKDPGGPTNQGITIGTLKRLGIDVDGDGDTDLVDLKSLRPSHVSRVYREFYWDTVKGDLLPAGVDYAMFDYAINSGPSRAIKDLQRVLKVPVDGDMGPVTLNAVLKADKAFVINALCDRRMAFLRGLKTWGTFGKGWSNRVGSVRLLALDLARRPEPVILGTEAEKPAQRAEAPQKPVQPVSPSPAAVAAQEVKPPPEVKSEAPVRLGWVEWAKRIFA